ncbi:MAG: CRISPR-associated endonuclease Cas2 [Myxococcales bacterium]|nr:CRISPR-associated endonuclease Cas2 [Myxococcota bacterium]MDW8284327.1 CRISPR-associated endonuclease Cas2 [Myxococcales bacterium]
MATHDSTRWRLVCYDIRDPTRYRRAHKLIKGYGETVQYSMFRCHLDDRQTAELRLELARVLSDEDSLLILDLCPRCASRVVSQNHKAGWDQEPASFLVVRSTKKEAEPDQAPPRAAGQKGEK